MTKKDTSRETGNEYEVRRKRRISIVAIILAVLFLLWTVAGSLMVTYAGTVSAQASSSASEMRGIWVSTVYGLDYPNTKTTDSGALRAQADAVIADCAKMGMNTIFLQVRPMSDAFYPSAYYPWSKYLTGTQGQAPSDGFDPLAYWVEQAHNQGIELHAWINPYRIATSEADWNSLADNHPAKSTYSSCVVRYTDGWYFDPGQPGSRELITKGVAEIVQNYDVDGIHFDDYFYPGTDFDDSASYAAYGNGQDKAEWRRNNVNLLVKQVNDTVHSIDSHCVFGISPMGIWANSSTSWLGSQTRGGESYSQRYADGYTWVKNHWIDYIAPQIYWKIGYAVADYEVLAKWWSDVVKGTDVKLYIGMADYRVPSSGMTFDNLVDELVLNDQIEGVDGEIHFRYQQVAGNADLYDLYERIYGGNPLPANTDPVNIVVEPDPTPTPDPDPAPGTLTDIAGHWAETYIQALVSDGKLSGMNDGTFRPDQNVTRAQFVRMLAAAAGANPVSTGSILFRDVDPSEWYAPYIEWAVDQGIVFGMGDGTFCPDDGITREQMAVMTVQTMKKMSAGYSGGTAALTFADAGSISDWAEDAVKEAVAAGILNGMEETDSKGQKILYFHPKGSATRAQASKVIYSLCYES